MEGHEEFEGPNHDKKWRQKHFTASYVGVKNRGRNNYIALHSSSEDKCWMSTYRI